VQTKQEQEIVPHGACERLFRDQR